MTTNPTTHDAYAAALAPDLRDVALRLRTAIHAAALRSLGVAPSGPPGQKDQGGT